MVVPVGCGECGIPSCVCVQVTGGGVVRWSSEGVLSCRVCWRGSPSSVISGCKKNKRIVRCFRGSSTCVSCRAITLPSPAGAPVIVGSDDNGVISAQQKSGARPYDAVLSESLAC